MKSRIVVFLPLIFFGLSLFGFLGAAYAANPDGQSRYEQTAAKVGTTNYFKFPNWLRFWQLRKSHQFPRAAKSGFKAEPFKMEHFKWEFRSKHSDRVIEVIHDYDDYTHIMRTYETKE
jgi:hypothetical protein